MVPRQAPMITDTPPTPIEPRENHFTGRLRSQSQQLLDTLIHEARSRSSSASSRHSRSPDNIKDVIAKLGLAAGTVGAEHIKPKNPREADVLEGVRVFLSGFQNIIRRAETNSLDTPETIEVGDDAQSVYSLHPITEAESNPFGTSTSADEDVAAEGEPQPERQFDAESSGERRQSQPQPISVSREESFGEFVMDIYLYEKESGQKLPGRARLDTGMTRNAVSYSHALMLGYPIEQYNDDPCIVADGTKYEPIGQVTLPFHFVTFRTAKTWRVEFIVFPDGCPFDVCLGRRFISLADLLKRNPEALPVQFEPLSAREEQEMKKRTKEAGRESNYRREQEDRKYGDRRKTKPKEKESRKWASPSEEKETDPAEANKDTKS